ncbi:MAG: hypothetical protein Q9204_005071, partial [Flavoplaca sp. TL-2023a]
ATEVAPDPHIAFTPPNPTSIPKATPIPIPFESDVTPLFTPHSPPNLQDSPKSQKLLADDDDLPDLNHLIKTSLPNRSAPTLLEPTTISNALLSPPTTPAKFPSPNLSLPCTTPSTPHRGLRPTRGVYPTPPQSRKRAASRALDNHHESKTSPWSSKRIRRSIYISSSPHTRSPAGAQISRFEAQRVGVSIMKQIDWDRVAKRVACNRSGRVYKRAVEGVLEGWQEGLDGVVGESEG